MARLFPQFLCMAFAQLSYRETIEACLRSLGAKLSHMGFRFSTLADANEYGGSMPISPRS